MKKVVKFLSTRYTVSLKQLGCTLLKHQCILLRRRVWPILEIGISPYSGAHELPLVVLCKKIIVPEINLGSTACEASAPILFYQLYHLNDSSLAMSRTQ